MAQNCSLVNFSGKLGPIIGYTVRGHRYFRSKPASVANPRTEAQQSHRRQFALVSSFVASLKKVYKLGYKEYRSERSPRVRFTEQVFADVLQPDGTLDLSFLHVARGPLEPLQVSDLQQTGNGLRLHFLHGHGNSNDRLSIVLYSQTKTASLLMQGVASRRGNALNISIPSEWQGDHIWVYAFWRDPKTGLASDSLLLAELGSPEGDLLKAAARQAFCRQLAHNWVRIKYPDSTAPTPETPSQPPD